MTRFTPIRTALILTYLAAVATLYLDLFVWRVGVMCYL